MINAVNATLDSSPQRFHRVYVDDAINVLFGRMLYDFMGIAKSLAIGLPPLNRRLARMLIERTNVCGYHQCPGYGRGHALANRHQSPLAN